MKRLFFTVFILAVATNLTAGFLGPGILSWISKPLIMLSLCGYYLFSGSGKFFTVIGAMVLSLAGDVLLLNESYFIPGLTAFLIAHVFYIFSYRQHRSEEWSDRPLQGIHKIRLAFPIILAGTGLVVILFPSLGNLKIPVVVYAVVITMMVMNALYRYGRTNDKSFWMVFCGAVFFFVSDSVIALNKFLFEISYSHFWVMLTYSAAQYLIVEGLIRHHKTKAGPVTYSG